MSDKVVVFEGYASIPDTLFDSAKGPTVIHRGAFLHTIAERFDRIEMWWNHQSDEPIGRLLALREDRHGLFVRAVLSTDTPRGQEVAAWLQTGVTAGLSPGFTTIKMNRIGPVRHFTEVRLQEISLCTSAANPFARVTLVQERSLSVDECLAELDAIQSAIDCRNFNTNWAELAILRRSISL